VTCSKRHTDASTHATAAGAVPAARVAPPTRPGAQWHAEIDSYDPAAAPVGMGKHQAGDQVTVGPCSITVLRGLLAGVMCITG